MATKPTGGGGTLEILDTGSYVEFWLSQSYTATFIESLPWSGYINGSGTGLKYFNWVSGGGRRLIARYLVTTSQQVYFEIGSTGTSGFGGPTRLTVNISRATQPNKVNKPTVSNITDKSMELTWTTPGNGGSSITRMLLRRYPTSNMSGSTYKDYDLAANATTYTPTDLTPKTDYWWVIYAQNAIGFSPQSDPLQVRTYAIPEKAPAPALTSLSSTSLQFLVTDPANNGSTITDRETRLSQTSNFATVLQTVTGATPLFSGLTRVTRYFASSRVKNGIGWSAWSSPTEASTQGSRPSAPTNYNVTDITSTTAYLSYPAVGDNGGLTLSGMRAEYNTVADPAGATVVTTESFRRPFLEGLTPGETYFVRLAVQNQGAGGGWSPFGAWISFTTRSDVPTPPTPLTAINVGDTTATLLWDAPASMNGASALGYELRYATDPDFAKGLVSMALPPSVFQRVLTGLQPGTQYYAQLWLRTDNGNGGYSTIVSFQTTGVSPEAKPLWIRLAGVWRTGIWWIRLDEMWRTGIPWVKEDGVWKRLS